MVQKAKKSGVKPEAIIFKKGITAEEIYAWIKAQAEQGAEGAIGGHAKKGGDTKGKG